MSKQKLIKVKYQCQDCGLPYGGDGWIEAIIPDNIWKIISPTKNLSGILCITCISRRIRKAGLDKIPVWLCGTEPLTAMSGDPAENLDLLRNYEVLNYKETKMQGEAMIDNECLVEMQRVFECGSHIDGREHWKDRDIDMMYEIIHAGDHLIGHVNEIVYDAESGESTLIHAMCRLMIARYKERQMELAADRDVE